MPNKRKNADLAIKYYSDDSIEIQFKDLGGNWVDVPTPSFYQDKEYREKPKLIHIQYRNFLGTTDSGAICIGVIYRKITGGTELESADHSSVSRNFIRWLGDWQLEVVLQE
jgi:hypothetical protein